MSSIIDIIVGFLIGFILATVIYKKGINININYRYEDVNNTNNTKNLELVAQAEQKMLKGDPKKDSEYKKFNEDLSLISKEVEDIIGGSDRV